MSVFNMCDVVSTKVARDLEEPTIYIMSREYAYTKEFKALLVSMKAKIKMFDDETKREFRYTEYFKLKDVERECIVLMYPSVEDVVAMDKRGWFYKNFRVYAITDNTDLIADTWEAPCDFFMGTPMKLAPMWLVGMDV